MPGRQIALIKHAHSGTNLYSDWNPGKDAGRRGAFRPAVQDLRRDGRARPQGAARTGVRADHPRHDLAAGGERPARATRPSDVRQEPRPLHRARARAVPRAGHAVRLRLRPAAAEPGRQRDLVRKGEKDVDQDSGIAAGGQGGVRRRDRRPEPAGRRPRTRGTPTTTSTSAPPARWNWAAGWRRRWRRRLTSRNDPATSPSAGFHNTRDSRLRSVKEQGASRVADSYEERAWNCPVNRAAS